MSVRLAGDCRQACCSAVNVRVGHRTDLKEIASNRWQISSRITFRLADPLVSKVEEKSEQSQLIEPGRRCESNSSRSHKWHWEYSNVLTRDLAATRSSQLTTEDKNAVDPSHWMYCVRTRIERHSMFPAFEIRSDTLDWIEHERWITKHKEGFSSLRRTHLKTPRRRHFSMRIGFNFSAAET